MQKSILNEIVISMNGSPVREYRLDSNADANGALRLEAVQECGYTEGGSLDACLPHVEIDYWDDPGSDAFAVDEVTDGLGAQTKFAYGNNTYSEQPFGTIPSIPNTVTATGMLVVSQMQQSNGLSSSGFRTWNYAYKSFRKGGGSFAANRGYIGPMERRVHDADRGIYTYYQHRGDFPFYGVASQMRSFVGTSSSGTELAREETLYDDSVSGSVYDPYHVSTTRWLLEGGTVVGGSIETTTLCYRSLSGDTCPGTGTTHEYVTQRAVTTEVGTSLTNPGFTPAFRGDVPSRAVGGLTHTETVLLNYQNTSSPWIRGGVVKRKVTSQTASETAKIVDTTYTLQAGTRVPRITTRLPASSTEKLVSTLTFTGNNLTSVQESGSNFTTRSTSLGSYVEDRYPGTVTNALSHQTTLQYDLRFGEVDRITDPNGNVTDIVFDAFGRSISTTLEDGTETTVTYERCDVAGCSAVTGAEAALKITTEVEDGSTQVAPTRVVYLDVLGREVLGEVEALDASDGWRRQRTEYNSEGRMQYTSIPYFSSQSTPTCTAADTDCTWYTYDDRDRVTRVDRPDTGYTTTSYAGSAGLITVDVTEYVKSSGGNETRRKFNTFNVLGQLTETIDAYSQADSITTTYDYDSHGNMDSVTVGGNEVATMTFGLIGNRTALVDDNLGTWTFTFDGLLNLKSIDDANSQKTLFTYDSLDRLTQRVDDDGGSNEVTNTWTWDPTYAKGYLGSVSTGSEYTQTYTYRSADSKLIEIETDIAVSGVHTGTYTTTYGYDGAARLASVQYPTGSTFTYGYSTRGYRTQLKSGSTVLEEVKKTDAFGSVSRMSFDNGLDTVVGYDEAGRIKSIETGTWSTSQTPNLTPTLQDLEYKWRSNSSLYKRIDHLGSDTTDSYSYDTLERVTSQVTTGTSRTLVYEYDAHGNFTEWKKGIDDLNSYSYDVALTKPHRLTAVTIDGIANTLATDANGNITEYDAASGDDTFLDYDGRNNVTRITVTSSDDADTTTPTARDEFWYDPHGQRYLGQTSWDESGQQQTQTVYFGNYEKVVTASGSIERTDLSASVRHLDDGTSSWFEYVHRDHLGSVDVITSSAGTLINSLSHDPFGGRRDADWSADLSATDMATILANEDDRYHRGFTDHEQLNRTGFIHMNGRVYDPRIGRFVSPDPIVQAPAFSQNYNRYSYVFNNPLSFVDPSGFETAFVPPQACLVDLEQTDGSPPRTIAPDREIAGPARGDISGGRPNSNSVITRHGGSGHFVAGQAAAAGDIGSRIPRDRNLQQPCDFAVGGSGGAAAQQGALPHSLTLSIYENEFFVPGFIGEFFRDGDEDIKVTLKPFVVQKFPLDFGFFVTVSAGKDLVPVPGYGIGAEIGFAGMEGIFADSYSLDVFANAAAVSITFDENGRVIALDAKAGGGLTAGVYKNLTVIGCTFREGCR